MRQAIFFLALTLVAAFGSGDSGVSTNDVGVTRKLLLTGARINSELTQVQWLKARFIEVGSTNTVIVDFHVSRTPHNNTLKTVITACVDWTTPKERDQWHEAKAEAIFDVVFITATNSLGDTLTRADVSKWSLVSLKLDSTKSK